ncbi:nucleolar GTP-binding protein 1 [Blastocystis sp. subtype 4]|uniref:nucleolar GTP-binding protein 1 n=1 Tax=Blastocystis sp. subtype 4 TaxID=944170 RepID=UPI000711D169|nr:nucleolar GTP-binding protein 1 [Blastocystis sp. subtype 4]KNB41527.1 nucleolar GTP-binding protein 1 [Blastocystis sp. subtype 4]|eukprot:XP_014524970.1 nucleolar GTP-binding protein 1 [Blastocystis sp. subtype 4]
MSKDFKSITAVPTGSELVDIILSKTQRKTPTVVRPGFKIKRIQAFYMRKVKFTQQNTIEKLQAIIDEFPRLEEIHPFFADLINVLYDRDHYKLALGQINTAKNVIAQIGQDYVRLLKYGDSLYRCKQLKHAALGRMCTVMKKLNASLCYLEEVRKHMSRLPAIDPTDRTLILCGFPNVGKSSFMNKITRANVDVQPYAFTTKSLFLGHMDYQFIRWQVIDTPGILDHPLEERNTIEMQSITAMAHLQAAILFFIDLSGQCTYSIEEQISLFKNIHPLFAGKPLFLICSKSDVLKYQDLNSEERQLIDEAVAESNATLMHVSSLQEEGIMEVRNAACEQLLMLRISNKMANRKSRSILDKLQIVQPKPRDNMVRGVEIPESVRRLQEMNAMTRTVRDTGRTGRAEKAEMEAARDAAGVPRRIGFDKKQWELGGPGVFSFPEYEHYRGQLENDEWITDCIPQFMDGKNVADFYDPDIEAKLKALEEEEEQLATEYENEQKPEDDKDYEEWLNKTYQMVHEKEILLANQRKVNKETNHAHIASKNRKRNLEDMVSRMDEMGLETDEVAKRSVKRSRSRMADRIAEDEEASAAMERKKSHSRKPQKDVADLSPSLQKKARVASHLSQRNMAFSGQKGEGDRYATASLQKYLNSGKRKNGTHYSR